ncbi:MAG TPA: sigma-70 family RNA polymerase sigma factor [Candidatus Limnocylindrales bacterium]|nr:sigma-70 family RNA polymerase sigma factor [Candidatus Limnocylindrales bacterium]
MTEGAIDVVGLVSARAADAYRLARAILLDDTEAEDAVQEASVAAWRARGSLRDPARFEPWFDRILINQCRDQLRRRRRAVRVAAPPIGFDPSAPRPDTGTDADLDRALDALDADHRIVVLLRYWQDRTVDDIADRVGIPAGTVKSRLHHALRSMRASLEASHGR